MSVNTTIATIKARMTDFKNELVIALNKATGRSPHADVADKLENLTPPQVIATLRNEVTKHTSQLGKGVHDVNVETLGTYTKAQFEYNFDQLLDVESDIPLSFYGDREFLPPAVTGSFESGSNTTPWGYVAMMLEDNGTLMILRSGTDGDTAGLFYAYLRNAMTEDLNKLIMSNVQYSPAYIPAGMKPFAILNSTQDLIIGTVVDKATLVQTGYFVSITNNTMDQTKHTGIFVPMGSIFQVVFHPVWTSSLLGVPTGYIKNGWAYFFCNLDAIGVMGYRVWRMPVANIIAGSFSGVERVTGWTINRGGAGVVVRDDLQIFDNIDDAFIRVGQPHTNHIPAASSPGRMTMVREDGRVLFTHQIYWQLAPTDGVIQEIGYLGAFTFEIPDSKVIDVAKYHNTKLVSNYTGSAFVLSDAPARPTTTGRSWINFFGGQACNSFYTTKFNQTWYWGTTTYFSNRVLYRLPGPPTMDPKDWLDMRTDTLPTDSGINVSGRHGSALTVSFSAPGNVGEDVIVCRNYIKPLNGAYGRYGVRSQLVGEPNFQYSSVTGNFAFRGFAPTLNRVTLASLGKPEVTTIAMVNESDPSGYMCHAGRFTYGTGQWIKGGNIDRDMNTSGGIFTTQACMDDLYNQIRNNLAARGIALWGGAAQPMMFEINLPQRYGDLPCFVFGQYIAANRSVYSFVYSVNITSGNRQSLNAAALVTGSFVQQIQDGPGTTAITLGPHEETGQSAFRRVNGGFVLGICPSIVMTITGDTEKSLHMLTYNGTWAFKGSSFWDYWTVAPMGWVNFPNRGLFMVLTSEFTRGQIDCGSKMLGTLAATSDFPAFTTNQLYDRLTNVNTSIVIISQKTVSAWTVYFSDPTPCMVDGSYTQIDQTTYELNPATDGNKTFYVWLVKRSGVISYQVVPMSAATPAADSALYLGYFTTNGEGINVVAVEKRVAIGGMELGRVSQGSAIPLTSGTPNSPGRLNWS